MQRFLRMPVRVTLATLLGVYKGVMRLSSIADALNDAIEEADDDHAKESEDTPQEAGTKTTDSQNGGQLMDSQNGGQLMRELLISPLQQVYLFR